MCMCMRGVWLYVCLCMYMHVCMYLCAHSHFEHSARLSFVQILLGLTEHTLSWEKGGMVSDNDCRDGDDDDNDTVVLAREDHYGDVFRMRLR